ncbi:hypothetical protein F383_24564 [Gossypium arboreum]|uniref:Uncharacterized protein n=1 Tax=Gossypium arboreum TaxID=29729 RepID=A0A0B0P2G7_GOSAR|nr:hypothetical protein F383_24564 [Gossypium arboreum]
MRQNQISQIFLRNTLTIPLLLNSSSDPRFTHPRNIHQPLRKSLTISKLSINFPGLSLWTPQQSSVFF